MKRKLVILTLCGTMIFGMTACGNNKVNNAKAEQAVEDNKIQHDEDSSTDNNADQNKENKIDSKTEDKNTSDAADTENSTDSKTEDKNKSDSDNTENVADETNEFSFNTISNMDFFFASGAGAWGTYLNINADGSFSGEYHDSDMGDTGEGYPNGICHESSFKGQFGALTKINDYTYATKVESLTTEREIGSSEISDGILYKYTEPYGINADAEIRIYLKGAPLSELPEEFLSWVGYANGVQNGEVMNFYGIHNLKGNEGFSGGNDIVEDNSAAGIESGTSSDIADEKSAIDAELADIEAKEAAIDQRIKEEDLTQVELNDLAAEKYKLWDDELNSIWKRLKEKLSEAEMAALTEEERAWVSDKEKQVEEEGSEYEGGSIRPMMENEKATELTKARVYVLAEKLK